VAEQFHHDARVNSLRKQQRRGRVPQVMDADARELAHPQNLGKLALQVPRFERRSDSSSEQNEASQAERDAARMDLKSAQAAFQTAEAAAVTLV